MGGEREMGGRGKNRSDGGGVVGGRKEGVGRGGGKGEG